MIDVKQQYQAIIFLDASSISPKPENISIMMELFRDKGFIPSMFHEISSNSPSPSIRLKLSDPKNEWNINFGTDRITIFKNPLEANGRNLGELSDFCDDVTTFFNRIHNKFRKKPNRIALATGFLLSEMNEEKLNAIYAKMFKTPDFYSSHLPFEWNWRSASKLSIKINELEETLNVITMINRVSGEMTFNNEITYFDRVQLSFDINTVHENSDYRFTLDHISNFYVQALEIHDQLIKEVTDAING